MSTTEVQEPIEMGTKPLPEHEWLNKLVGTWKVTSEMMMPDGTQATGEGTEEVVNFGGLWAIGEGKATMPDGAPMEYRSGLGYDVSFKAYKAFWVANVSSHLWKYDCELSADGKKMTMNCVGPDMMGDAETANYRDEIDIIDDNNRTLTSYGQQPDGSWVQFMKATYRRA
jgi:hypothetical protein